MRYLSDLSFCESAYYLSNINNRTASYLYLLTDGATSAKIWKPGSPLLRVGSSCGRIWKFDVNLLSYVFQRREKSNFSIFYVYRASDVAGLLEPVSVPLSVTDPSSAKTFQTSISVYNGSRRLSTFNFYTTCTPGILPILESVLPWILRGTSCFEAVNYVWGLKNVFTAISSLSITIFGMWFLLY